MSDYLKKIVTLTKNQYDTLVSGGTVGSQTGLNPDYFYYVTDEDEKDTPVYTELTRKQNDKGTLIIKAHGIENFKGTPKIFVYTCPRRKSTYYWRHPVSYENNAPINPTTNKKIGCKYGYTTLIGVPYASEKGGNTYPSAPNWMTQTSLTTEFTLSNNTLEIDLLNWILPLVKPGMLDNSFTWSFVGLIGVESEKAPLLFKFLLVDYINENNYRIYQSTKNILNIGLKRNQSIDLTNGPNAEHSGYSVPNFYISIK